MLNVPTPDQLIALEQATKLPRWRDIDMMIEAELSAVLDRILGATDTAVLHELRGRAKALKEFQQTARDASATLVKMGVRSPL
jgi:hypothetical protein